MIGSYLLLNEDSKAMACWLNLHPDQKSKDFNPALYKEKASSFPLTLDELSELETNEKENATEIILNRRWKWFIGFRDITNSTNERTMLLTVIPVSAVSNKLPLIIPKDDKFDPALFISQYSSLPFDYIARQKVSGTNINFFIINQFVTIPRNFYPSKIATQISTIVTKLTCSASSLIDFSHNLSSKHPFYPWDENLRFNLKCELDAIYAHLYELTRDELDYILETFPIVKRKDMEKYGRYRTKDTILQLFDQKIWEQE